MNIHAHNRCLVMGILNVTEDSFSDGGSWNTPSKALDHAHDLITNGADIIDIGGESTRPGARRVSEEEELDRVIPIVEALAHENITISVDTMRASVAQQSAHAGAALINDVSGGLADPDMYRTIAATGLPCILMHWDTAGKDYGDASGDSHEGRNLLDDIHQHFNAIIADACAHGINRDNIILDPGIGFCKSRAGDWEILRALPTLVDSGFPILVGQSRKRFLGELRSTYTTENHITDRDPATHAVSALAAYHGAWAVRVHDVAGSRDAVEVAARWRETHG